MLRTPALKARASDLRDRKHERSCCSQVSCCKRRFIAVMFTEYSGPGPVTDLEAGSTFLVSWYLGYAHVVSP